MTAGLKRSALNKRRVPTKPPGTLEPVSDWTGEGTFSCWGASCIDQGSQWISTFTVETTNHTSSPEETGGLHKGRASIKPWEGPLGEGLALGWLMRWVLNRTHGRTHANNWPNWWERNNQSRCEAKGARLSSAPTAIRVGWIREMERGSRKEQKRRV